MGVVCQQRLPSDVKHHLRGGLEAFVVGDGEKRFGLQFEEGLRFVVGLLHAGAGRDAVRDEPEIAVAVAGGIAEFALADGHVMGGRLRLLEEGGQRGMLDVEAGPCGFRFLHVFWRVGGGMHVVDGVRAGLFDVAVSGFENAAGSDERAVADLVL